jgi:hypothetical protein
LTSASSANSTNEFFARHSGHDEVGHNDLGLKPLQDSKRFAPVACVLHEIARCVQCQSQSIELIRVVLDYEYTGATSIAH